MVLALAGDSTITRFLLMKRVLQTSEIGANINELSLKAPNQF
jgi:hypothetical protein